MQLTEEQYKVLECTWGMRRGELLKIEACAGSGKTFTLVEIARSIPRASFLYLAFNRTIVEEARVKFPANVTVMTTHSLAYQAVVRTRFHGRTITPQLRPFDLQFVLPKLRPEQRFHALQRFKNWCAGADPVRPDGEVSAIFDAALAGELPLTHDIYLKVYQMTKDKGLDGFDFILLDEAQDTNDVTLDIFMSNTCRKILVGDRHQSIYGFRGAVNALSKVRCDYDLHLTHSFRSRQPILDKANYFIRQYAIDGAATPDMVSAYAPLERPQLDAFLTRTNAGLIDKIALIREEKTQGSYNLIKTPISIFGPALNIFSFKNGRMDKIDASFSWLKNFKDYDEFCAYVKDSGDYELQSAQRVVDLYKGDLFTLYQEAQILYQNHRGGIVLSNAHLAKGMEWRKVQLHDDFPLLSKLKDDLPAPEDGQSELQSGPELFAFQQEVNLYYVALTRAREMVVDLSENEDEYARHLGLPVKKRRPQPAAAPAAKVEVRVFKPKNKPQKAGGKSKSTGRKKGRSAGKTFHLTGA